MSLSACHCQYQFKLHVRPCEQLTCYQLLWRETPRTVVHSSLAIPTSVGCRAPFLKVFCTLCCCEETAACHWKTLDWAYGLNLINQTTCATSTMSGFPSATTHTVEQLSSWEKQQPLAKMKWCKRRHKLSPFYVLGRRQRVLPPSQQD